MTACPRSPKSASRQQQAAEKGGNPSFILRQAHGEAKRFQRLPHGERVVVRQAHHEAMGRIVSVEASRAFVFRDPRSGNTGEIGGLAAFALTIPLSAEDVLQPVLVNVTCACLYRLICERGAGACTSWRSPSFIGAEQAFYLSRLGRAVRRRARPEQGKPEAPQLT